MSSCLSIVIAIVASMILKQFALESCGKLGRRGVLNEAHGRIFFFVYAHLRPIMLLENVRVDMVMNSVPAIAPQ